MESTRVYANLVRCGAGLEYLDVGGGLGVDYDGSQTDFASSVNYTLQEYGNDVVYHIQTICDDAGVPHPHIITESGRAVVAYHSALLFNVLGVTRQESQVAIPEKRRSRRRSRSVTSTTRSMNSSRAMCSSRFTTPSSGWIRRSICSVRAT